MRKDHNFRIVVIVCIAIAGMTTILRIWDILKDSLEKYVIGMSEYHTETTDFEEGFEDDFEDVFEDDFEEDLENEFSGEHQIIYINDKTSYRALIEDDARLLDAGEKQELAALMQDITVYGNVAFKTIDENSSSTETYARQYYREQFGTDSGTLFLIDMDNRNIWIHSDGNIYKVITASYADTITDNVYRYASAGDYYECAAHTYEQILSLLQGNKIAQPMKYISNGLLAVILALLLNYGLVSYFSRIRKPGRRELLRNGRNHFNYTQPRAFFVRESRTYNPTSSGSSDSGGGGSSSSGSSGGSSGGGGGHSF